MSSNNYQTTGLSAIEVQKQLEKFGLNQLAKPHEIKFLAIAKEEIAEPMMLLLLGVGIVYSLWGKIGDAITIFIIIFVMIFVEVWNEFKAKKAISALSKIAAPKTKVLREGQITEIETDQTVPRDILVLNSGTRISADGLLFTALSLQIDESSLTGESLSVAKNVGDDIYAGTLVVAGEGKAEVITTGTATKFGKISALAQEIRPPRTPLQLAMKRLSRSLVWVALFFSISIPILGLLRGQNFKEMVLTGLALSFAVIPEELPFVITLILGLGAYQLSKQNFLIKKIKAAEVLGDTTIILTDKTGTLTENKMKVVSVYPPGEEKTVLKFAAALITDMSLFATDKAIRQKALELQAENAPGDIVSEKGFGDGRKIKAVLRKQDGNLQLYISGAPEELFGLTKDDITAYQRELTTETDKGRRVIGVATKAIPAADQDQAYAFLEMGVTVVGLISIEDSPRAGVKEALELARTAGIRTIMVTGDHPQTARYIAQVVGIPSAQAVTGDQLDTFSDKELQKIVNEVSVFARSTPEHKYRLLQALQINGEIVAVTGDGVNDTLALKGANIGIAMGIKGTDAAKEAADVVLADDNYSTIASAIFAGRKFYDNLQKGVGYYLAAKAALVLVFLVPVIVGVPFPFAPIQIIVLEMFMDLAASSGFVTEPAEKTIYQSVPKGSQEKFLGKKMVINIALSALSLFAAVIIPYFYALGQHLPLLQAQTIAFSGWMIGHVMLAMVSRSKEEPLHSLGLFSNRVIDVWAFCACVFLLTATAISPLGNLLKLGSISWANLGLVFVVAFLATFWKEIVKVIAYSRR
ncbi:MAG: cation-transporting P-type ATPase [Firmicutes bacterium]|nr:cation-transporting P-type ATPase [Bacillota bacterium]